VKIVVLLRRLRAVPGRPASAVLGACERAALRAAIALRRSRPGATLTAVAVGDERDEEALAFAAAAQAHTVRLWHAAFEGADYDALARGISAVCRTIGFDLVLAGERSADEGLGAVGPASAEHLGIPHLTAARELSWEAGGRLRLGRAFAPCLLGSPPLLVTVSADHPSDVELPAPGPGLAKAELYDLSRVGLLPEELRHRRQYYGELSPRARPVEMLPGVEALVAHLRGRVGRR
jgi:electron transfer flavoprotein beta subunit